MKTKNNENSREPGLVPDLDSLITKMKKRDEYQKKNYRRFYILMVVLVVFYFLLLVANPDPYLTMLMRISGLCYVVAFLTGAYLFRMEHKSMLKIDYSRPLLEMMKGAVERYRPFKKGFVWFLLVPLFVDLGITLGGSTRYMPEAWSMQEKILVLQLVYWAIMFIAGLIGFLVWRKRVRPYRDAVNKMIAELGDSE